MRRKIENFAKLLQVAILLFNAIGLLGLSERSEIGVFFKKKQWFFENKSQVILRNAKGSNCDKELDWNGGNTQNVQILKFLRKKRWKFRKKSRRFSNNLNVAKLM